MKEVRHPTIKRNLLDRAIEAVAPAWGMQRLKARGMLALAGGYFGPGGRRNRPGLSNWNPGVADADGDISPDLVDLRAYSRDLARRAPLAIGAINTVVTNVIGTGLSMQPAPDQDYLGLDEDQAKAWQQHVAREWKLWAESTDCDITRTQNIYGLQSLAFRSALESGDVFAILPAVERLGQPYELAVQLIEADRVSNPNGRANTATLVDGVEMDEFGAPIAYHVCRSHPGAFGRQLKGQVWDRIEAFGTTTGRRRVLHVFERRRPGQTRGVPYLAGIIEPLKQLTRYTEAEIAAAVNSAAFALFAKMDHEAFGELFTDAEQRTLVASGTSWDGTLGGASATLDSPGKVINLLPGESIEAPDLKRPNVAFDPFVMACLRQIGVALELPFEVLVKHFESSYSAARAALLDAWRFFRTRRDFMASYFCQPIYQTWLAEAVAIRRVAAPGFFADAAWRNAWSAAVWVGDGPGSIDPLKEIDAAVERIAAGVSTIAAESILFDGVDWETKLRQRAREVKARRAAGLEAELPDVGTGGTAAPAAKAYPSDTAADIDERGARRSRAPAAAGASGPVVGAAHEGLVDAMSAMSASIAAMAAREQMAPRTDVTFQIGVDDMRAAASAAMDTMVAGHASTLQQIREDFQAMPIIIPAPVVNFSAPDVHVDVAAPVVNLEATIEQPKEQTMRIIGMPDRLTNSTVERDGKGNIIKTTQKESDA